MKINTVFVDIDSTLTDSLPGMGEVSLCNLLLGLVSENNGISLEEAQERIRKMEKFVGNINGRFWPFGIISQLNVTENQLWNVLAADAQKRLFMHEDAKALLIGLKTRHPDVKVFTATTNPRLIIYAKLAIAGFANQNGSHYLDGAFGGEEVYPGGKSCPEFYTALLKRTDADPETTLMVGDNPQMDLALAKAAGIKQVALPRREQKMDKILEDDGGLYLKRLDYILNFKSFSEI